MLLGMIMDYDKYCRAALAAGAPMSKLTTIPAKDKIGRAKSVPADQYKAVYTQIVEEMKAQIEEASQGGDEA